MSGLHFYKREIGRCQPAQDGGNPADECCGSNDHERVDKPLDAGAHVLFGHVDSACDEREAGDDEEHGSDVAGLMI